MVLWSSYSVINSDIYCYTLYYLIRKYLKFNDSTMNRLNSGLVKAKGDKEGFLSLPFMCLKVHTDAGYPQNKCSIDIIRFTQRTTAESPQRLVFQHDMPKANGFSFTTQTVLCVCLWSVEVCEHKSIILFFSLKEHPFV